MCSFLDQLGIDAMDTFTCEPIWVRLNAAPLPPSQRSYDDATTGGLNGTFYYAVRPVGPNGVENDIGKFLSASLVNYNESDPSLGDQQHCKAGTTLTKFPSYVPSTGRVFEMTPAEFDAAVVALNAAARSGAAGGPPPPPSNVTQKILTKNLKDTDGSSPYRRATEFAKIAWNMSAVPSDLMGFHVETAGSPNGPWQRLTKHPVASWEDRYIAQGVGLPGRCDAYAGHTECLRYRVLAVDESGNESVLVNAVSEEPLPVACEPATPPPPTNLHASTAPSLSPCQIKLDWDSSSGAAEYHVYRMMWAVNHWYFYDTATVNTTSFTERGDWDAPCTSDDCPYWPPQSSCRAGAGLEAYYVTARKTSAGESPRSNLVFWDCLEPDGYQAALINASPGDAIASSSKTIPVESLACWNNDDGRLEALVEALAATDTSALEALATTPMLRLGELTNPPWGILDLHTDHLGTVRAITDVNGQLVSVHNYFPFGEEVQDTFSYNTHQYTGHERDDDTGLDYMLARYYGGSVPRFLSPDPIGGSARNPQSWNRYAYVLGNPMKLVDPTGLIWAPGTTPPGGTAGPWGPCYRCDLSYDLSFSNRLKSDPKFKRGFDAYRGTDSGRQQLAAMKKDTSTMYTLKVGDVIAGLGMYEVESGLGMTLGEGGRTPVTKNEKQGKLDEGEVSVTINADYLERTNNPIADALFEEASHALAMGSNTMSASEGFALEERFHTNQEPTWNLFREQLLLLPRN